MEFFDAVFEFSVITPFITITSLVIGFTLASVMVDHREGKQLPTEIAWHIFEQLMIASEPNLVVCKVKIFQICRNVILHFASPS
jgi:hypothetical protein